MHLQYYQQVEPIPAARHVVRRIIYCDCPEPVTLDVPAPPTGYNHIGWAMRGHGAKITCEGMLPVGEGEVHFAGQTVRTNARVLLYGRVRHILAEMTPIGLYSTFGVLAEPLVNRVYSAGLTGRGGLQRAVSRISPDADMEEALVRFQRALIADYANAGVPRYISFAAGAIEESGGMVELPSLLRGVSERQMQRGFKQIVGCTPKYFSQLLRVNATIVSLTDRRGANLAQIAADHGFSDQAHMVRTVQSFFGHAPSEIRNNVNMLLRAFPTATPHELR